LSSQSSLTIPALAREFGLRDDLHAYQEIDEFTARRLIFLILHRDLAYNSEVMPESRATELADRFLGQFSVGARFFTNGTFYERQRHTTWNPVTEATFDTGVLILGPKCSGCLWVEDED
jgi:hypothetical protein